ncbi:MAG: hypothetical protein MJY62_06615, partial [Bacteroidales bacterium]|nr:hypothetical protein [Bacteroidales bacterium]
AWTSEDTPDGATGFTCNADCFGSDHWLFLIPQQLNSPAVLKATVSGNGGSATKEIYLTGYTWKPGYKYQYTISYHEAQDELVVKINEYQNSTGQWTD